MPEALHLIHGSKMGSGLRSGEFDGYSSVVLLSRNTTDAGTK